MTIGVAGVCAFWTGLAGLVVGIVLDIFFGVHFLGSSSFNLMIAGALVGGVGGGLVWGVSTASQDAKQAAEERVREERARLDDLNALSAQALSACHEAVQAFEYLPTCLVNARGWSVEARQHFAYHAYSPFWAAIENAYDNLGHYNQRLNFIAELARGHAHAAAEYVRRGGTERLPAFPVHLDAARALDAAAPVLRTLNETVYEAQRDPVFAQIWEQRRTTVAVIAGFANLERAVNLMSSTIGASIRSLSAEVRGVGAEVSSASSTATALGNSQLVVQQQLNAKIDSVVLSLREEEKRALRL
ncbi:hypothetical protein Q0F99_06735 [Rathayibacter oskolensis]|uniref:hypothetical protein n=1 Tax=Rathayibacter oskolensis TaxID=1891671 RepID=UPI00265FC969|nr:hypothetical protein [Rathayibacter oskolensis]WKK72624.1 hypothetical protein Q0F99_06735 [Rathayibacter oskolensis]